MRLTESALSRPVAVTVVSVVALLLGITAVTRMPVDLLPSIEYPRLTIETTYPPSSPYEVERLVTDPLENALASVRGLRGYTSMSYGDRSRITLEFDWGADMDFVRLEVREKLDVAAWSLPDAAGRPVLVEYDPSRRPFMEVLVRGGSDWIETTDFARRVISTRLEQVDGVAACELEGGADPIVAVRLREGAVEEVGLLPDQVASALAASNANLQGGLVREGEREFFLTLEGSFTNLEDVGSTVVGFAGSTPIQLSDVAAISLEERRPTSYALCDGERCIILRVRKTAEGNTVETARGVEALLEEMRTQFPSVSLEVLQNDATFIEDAVKGVEEALLMGSFLAFAVLFLFLREWRSPLIMGASIPLSVAIALFALSLSGVTLNIMSLGGLALGTGMLVDNSIVVIEAIHRRRESGEGPLEAALNGTKEVGGAIVASTLTTVVVFFPVVYLEGVASQLFRDQALAVSYALLASLAVAVTVVPLLASRVKGVRSGEDLTSRMRLRYAAWVSRVIRRPRPALLLSLIVFMAAAIGAAFIPSQLLPASPSSQIDMSFSAPEGTPLEQLVEDARHAGDLASSAGSQRVSGRAGIRSEEGVDVFLTADFSSIRAARSAAARVPQAWDRLFVFPISADERASLLGEILGGGSGLTVYLEGDAIGDDLAAAESLSAGSTAIPGVTGSELGFLPGRPEILLRIDSELAQLSGISAERIGDYLESLARGVAATTYYRQDERVDVLLLTGAGEGIEFADLLGRSIPVDGVLLPLSRLVSQERRSPPGFIEHYQGNRAVSLRVFSSGTDLAGLASRLEDMSADMDIPAGVRLRTGPEVEEMRRTASGLLLAALLAIGLVYVLMAVQFESLRNPFVVMFTVPMGLIGVVAALAVCGQSWNALSGIGLVILSGIVVNDGILLVERISQLRKEGMPRDEAIVQAGRDRFRPVLMTATTTVLGLLPMAISTGTGGTLRQPLAIAVIGGITVATALTLVLVPILYRALPGSDKG
jgi:HAE1 family hydrophobic/amphiphilic exporter-1